MNTILQLKQERQRGFTLVELAIVMIIIGLLIGGILKGQELVSNAEVTAGVSQLKTVDAGISTFQDAYNALPGDIASPATRIPACAGNCNTVAAAGENANGRIQQTPDAAQALGNEASAFWSQLSAANILGGIVSSPAAAVIGESHPEFPVNGGIKIGYHPGGAIAAGQTTTTAIAPLPAGHYIATTIALGTANTAGSAKALTPGEAFRIDTKIDDNRPNTGNVVAIGATAAGATQCATGTAIANEYATSQTNLNCDIYVKMQN